ncbi:MAG: hypothetical protein ACKVU1_07855 [bacterium]
MTRAAAIAVAFLGIELACSPALALESTGALDGPRSAPYSVDDAARRVIASAGDLRNAASDANGAEFLPASELSASPDHRAPAKAFLLSMLVPGLGHRYAGHDQRALAFFLGEAGLWTAYAVYKIQGNAREEDFEEWARLFSGANSDGVERDEEYYQRVSRYLSSDDYNFEVKAIARLIYPGDTPEVRAQQLAYIEENSLRGDDAWEWTSPDRRNDFRVIRHRSLQADRHAHWTLGSLVLLRALSAIDAVRLAKHDNRAHADVGFSASPILPGGQTGLSLVYSRQF